MTNLLDSFECDRLSRLRWLAGPNYNYYERVVNSGWRALVGLGRPVNPLCVNSNTTCLIKWVITFDPNMTHE